MKVSTSAGAMHGIAAEAGGQAIGRASEPVREARVVTPPVAGGGANGGGAAGTRVARSRGTRWTPGRWLKPLVFLASLAPFVLLVQALLTGGLGENPIETLTDRTGTFAIRFLLISLALTPLRWLLKDVWPVRLRRMLGLFAFFYAALHVTIYVVLDREIDLALVLEDLTERPFVMAGFVAFAVFVPLTATSTKGMARRLGRRWQVLHRWVYVAATAAVVHYVWLAKGDRIEPFVYLGVLFVLLAWRLGRQATR